MFDYNYIIPKEEYDNSLTKIPLGQIFDLKDSLLQPKVRLKLKVTRVRSLGDNKVDVSDIIIPAELEVSWTTEEVAKILKENFIETNGFAVIDLRITAFVQDFWDHPLGTKTISVIIGNSTTKKEQDIAELKKLKEQNERALTAKNQRISNQEQALAAKNQRISNQEQALAAKNQRINTLQQNQKQVEKALEEAKTTLEEAKAVQQNITRIYAEASKDLLDKVETLVSSSDTKNFQQALQTTFDKGIDTKLKEQYKTDYYKVQNELINIIKDKTSQASAIIQSEKKLRTYPKLKPHMHSLYLLTNAIESIERSGIALKHREALKDLESFRKKIYYLREHYEINDFSDNSWIWEKLDRTYFAGAIHEVLEELNNAKDIISSYLKEKDKHKFYLVCNYIESLNGNPSFINSYTIDPQAKITVGKKPLIIDKATNVMELIDEIPEGTEKIIWCDHTPGNDTAGISYPYGKIRKSTKRFHEDHLNSFKARSFLPGQPDTVNMFTIAAKLKNGNITMPLTFLSKTPALSGGK